MKIEIDTDDLTQEQKRVLGLCADEDSRTPAQKAGWEIGYYGIVTEENLFSEGSIVRLLHDDYSLCPKFELVVGVTDHYTEDFQGGVVRGAYEMLSNVKLVGKGVGKYE